MVKDFIDIAPPSATGSNRLTLVASANTVATKKTIMRVTGEGITKSCEVIQNSNVDKIPVPVFITLAVKDEGTLLPLRKPNTTWFFCGIFRPDTGTGYERQGTYDVKSTLTPQVFIMPIYWRIPMEITVEFDQIFQSTIYERFSITLNVWADLIKRSLLGTTSSIVDVSGTSTLLRKWFNPFNAPAIVLIENTGLGVLYFELIVEQVKPT